jgi:outer membrane protein assembly factor BamB
MWWKLLALCAVLCLFAARTLPAQKSAVASENIVVKTDRTLQVIFDLVRESAAQKDYQKMFDRLSEMEKFIEKNGDDFLLPDEDNLYRPVRQSVLRLLASLPEDAFRDRRTGIDARAKGVFDEARAACSAPLLERVARDYPLSVYAPVALEYALDLQLESGDFASVLRTLRRIRVVAARLKQEITVRLCLKELAALVQIGERGEFDEAARRFAAIQSKSPLQFAGRTVEPSQALELLKEIFSPEAASGGRRFSRIGAMTASYRFPTVGSLTSNRAGKESGSVAAANDSIVSVTDGRFLQAWMSGASQSEAPLRLPAGGLMVAPSWSDNAVHKPAVWGMNVAATLTASEQQHIYAYDAASRSLIWSTEESPELAGAYFLTSPVYADGVLFAGIVKIERETLCYLLAIDAQTGKVLWKRLIVSGFPTNSLMLGCSPAPPVVKNRTVYFLTNLGAFAAVDAVTGEIEFLYRYREHPCRLRAQTILTEERWAITEPLLCSGKVIFAPQDCAYLCAVDAASGEFLWQFPRVDFEKYRFVCCAGDDRIILCGTEALALSCHTGLPLWESSLPAPAAARPVCAGNKIFVSDNLSVVILDAQTGGSIGRQILPPLARGGNLSLYDKLLFSCTGEAFVQFLDWSESEPMLRRRVSENPQDPEVLLDFVRALLTAGELDECEKVCDRLLQLLVELKRDAQREEVRRILLATLLEHARLSENPAERANYLEKASNLADVPDSLRLLFEAAGIYENEKLPRKSLSAYQSVLERSDEATLEISGVPNVGAAGYARERIRELIAAHGRTVYAPVEEKAKELLAKGRESALKVDIMRLIKNYPNSEAALEAYLDLATLCEREGSPETAARYLRELLYLAGGTQSETVVRARQMLVSISITTSEKLGAGIKCPLTKVWQTLPSALGEVYQIVASLERPELLIAVSENSIECRGTADGTLIWRREIENADSYRRSPLVHKGKSLFLVLGKHIVCLDILTGEELWNFTITDPPEGLRNLPRTEPVLIPSGDVIAVWYPQFRIMCLRAQKGEKLWEKTLEEEASAAFSCGDFIVCCSGRTDTVTVIEATTGKVLHKTKIENATILSAFPLPKTGRVILRGAREFYCLDVVSGKVLWKKTSDIYLPNIMPDNSEDRVILFSPISGKSLKVLCLSAKDGSAIWQFGSSESELERVWVEKDVIWIAAREGASSVCVEGLDCATGITKWVWQEPLSGSVNFFNIPEYLIVTVDGIGPVGRFTTVNLLSKRSGIVEQRIVINGFYARSAAKAGNNLIIATDGCLFSFQSIYADVLNLKIPALVRQIEKNPNDIGASSELAQALFALGRFSDAAVVLERAVLLESAATKETEFARLFERLNSCAFAAAEQPKDPLTARRFRSAPKIDGELTDEWQRPFSVKLDRPVCVFPVQSIQAGSPPWFSREDLSAELYLGYDEKNFYFLLDVKDSILRPSEREQRDSWVGDLLLVAVDSLADGCYTSREDDFMISMGLTIPRRNLTEAEREEEERSKPAGEYFVKRKEDGSGAIYEGAIPWRTFREHGCTIDETKGPDAGFSFAVNFILTDDDSGGGSRKSLNLTPGVLLTRGKNPWSICIPKLFAKVVLEESNAGEKAR